MKWVTALSLLPLLIFTPARADCPPPGEQERLARAAYEEALVQEATGNLGAARKMYEKLLEEFSESQFACWAKEHLDLIKSGRAYINKEGRAFFISSTTLFGAWAGFAISEIASLGENGEISENENKAIIWGSIGGAVAGLVPSIMLSSDLPMSTGRATMVNFGWTWGVWHGLAFSLIPDGDLGARTMLGLALGLSSVGYAGALAITKYLDVADGDAAYISSAAYWATWITAAISTLISEDFWDKEQLYISILLAGGDLGLLAAALTSNWFDMSAGRVGLINLGGALGVLVGVGVVALAEMDSWRAGLGTVLGFSLAGLVGSTFLTRNYDKPEAMGKGLALLELDEEGLKFSLPAPRLLAARDEGRLRLGLELPLVGGTF
jgi:hypothetical protein